ncbi:hypothetical protein PVAP13_7KG233166, partial [Panicum virgatum]
AFAGVHTLSFVQEETSASSSTGASRCNVLSYQLDKEERRRNAEFIALVDAAVSCRRRCGAGPGLVTFRVVFDAFHHSLAGHVDRWHAAAAAAAEEITVDACQQERGVCARERPDWYFQRRGPCGEQRSLKDESDGEDSDEFHDPNVRDSAYRLPRWLWLHSSGVRLADLTLDSCRLVRAVAVLDKRPWRLALRCCHGARLTVDASDLHALKYKGPVPDESVLSFAGAPPAILSCDIEFCGKRASSSEAELANLPGFLARFTAARCRSTIGALTRILEQTPNLEVLTLLILPDVEERPRYRAEVTCDQMEGPDDVPDVLPVIPCLREMNVVHYQGRVRQRRLLKLLLHTAAALGELYVVFPPGEDRGAVQGSKLMGQIESWVMNRPIKFTFG